MRKQRLWVPFLLVLPLSGCGIGSNTTITSSVAGTGSSTLSVTATGSVHGGNQPVSGSTIQLYAVGSTGYGSTPAALLNTTVTSSDGTGTMDSNANAGNNYNLLPASSFTITGDYTCPASNPQVYITATGGNPGLAAGTNNSAIFLVSGLFDCNSLKTLGATEILNINEVTTVATAYALAHFIDPATGNIGAYSYSNQGLVNALATIGNLVNLGTGTANTLTIKGNGVVPQQEINTLADILVPCVNSTLSTSPNCVSLFSAAKPPTGSTPSNVFSAAVDIALNPGNNVGTLFGLSSADAAFQPTLSTPGPNDWSMALSFAGTGSGATSLAIDGTDAVWVAAFAAGKNNSSLSRINNLGVNTFFDSGSTAAYSAYAVSLDQNGEAWVTIDDSSVGGTYEFNSSGNSLAGPFMFTETQLPEGVAIDGYNDIWVGNSGSSSVTEMVQGSLPGNISYISPNNTGYIGGDLSGPNGIAIDGNNNAWVANYNGGAGNSITQITQTQIVTGFTGGGLQAPIAVAIDGNNNVWVANYYSGSTTVSAFSNSGSPLVPSGFSGGGILNPVALAVDGADNIWIANGSSSANSISELNSSGSALSPATTGYQGGQVGNLKNPGAIGIDASGNVWVASRTPTTITTSSGPVSASITEFVGLAAPTITPLASAVSSGQIGEVPGTPIPVQLLSGALPDYSSAVSYYAQLFATGGNSGTYTYSLVASSLPTGLTLSSSGGITGSSTVTGTTTFSVKVCDAAALTNCTTNTLTLTASNSLPLGGSESLLNGRYIMRLGGFNDNSITPGLVNGAAVVNSLVFDGAGHITSISNDFNNPGGNTTLASSRAGTGYYTIGADHRGIMVFNYPSSGIALEFAFSVGEINGSSIATDMRIIEFDDTRPAGSHPYFTTSGEGKLQTATAPSTNQAYIFGFQGETPCVTYNSNGCTNGSFTPFGSVSLIGRFYMDNAHNVTGGVEDGGANSTSYNGVTFSGTYTTPDSTGRGTMTITTTGSIFPEAPTDFIYYVVSPTELYVMSIDPHSTRTLLSGDVLAQTDTFSPSYTLSGNIVSYESAPDNGDGVSTFPNETGAGLVYISATTGVQTVSAVVEENDNGSVKLGKQQGTFPYTIDSNGRMILAGGGNGTPVFYFANSTQGFGTEQPSASNTGDAGLLTLEGQSAGPFTCTSANGTYILGTVQAPVPLGLSSGVVVQNGTGVAALTIDNTDPLGVLSPDQSESFTCAAADITPPNGTSGRFTFTSSDQTNVGYAISPTRTVIINSSPGGTTPEAFIIQK